jgi:hypothetical protein
MYVFRWRRPSVGNHSVRHGRKVLRVLIECGNAGVHSGVVPYCGAQPRSWVVQRPCRHCPYACTLSLESGECRVERQSQRLTGPQAHHMVGKHGHCVRVAAFKNMEACRLVCSYRSFAEDGCHNFRLDQECQVQQISGFPAELEGKTIEKEGQRGGWRCIVDLFGIWCEMNCLNSELLWHGIWNCIFNYFYLRLLNHPPARRQLVAAIRNDYVLGHEGDFDEAWFLWTAYNRSKVGQIVLPWTTPLATFYEIC